MNTKILFLTFHISSSLHNTYFFFFTFINFLTQMENPVVFLFRFRFFLILIVPKYIFWIWMLNHPWVLQQTEGGYAGWEDDEQCFSYSIHPSPLLVLGLLFLACSFIFFLVKMNDAIMLMRMGMCMMMIMVITLSNAM